MAFGIWHLDTHLRAERPPAKHHGTHHVLVTLVVTAVGRGTKHPNQTSRTALCPVTHAITTTVASER